MLEQLNDATEMLATEQYPNASCILPLLSMLLDTVLNTENDTLLLNNFKKKVKNGLESRFTVPGDAGFHKSFPVMASFLDPRHETLKFVPNAAERDAVHDHIMALLQSSTGLKRQEDGQPKPKKKRKHYSVAWMETLLKSMREKVLMQKLKDVLQSQCRSEIH